MRGMGQKGWHWAQQGSRARGERRRRRRPPAAACTKCWFFQCSMGRSDLRSRRRRRIMLCAQDAQRGWMSPRAVGGMVLMGGMTSAGGAAAAAGRQGEGGVGGPPAGRRPLTPRSL
jgi:hypothetical protein